MRLKIELMVNIYFWELKKNTFGKKVFRKHEVFGEFVFTVLEKCITSPIQNVESEQMKCSGKTQEFRNREVFGGMNKKF
jgi:hypothetical protein